MFRNTAILRERPTVFIIIGIIFMAAGFIIGCLSVASFGLGSNIQQWAAVAICFSIGGSFFVKGYRQRRYNMLIQTRNAGPPPAGSVLAFSCDGYTNTGNDNQNSTIDGNINPPPYPVQPFPYSTASYPPPGAFPEYAVGTSPYGNHTRPVELGNPANGYLPPPPSYVDATKQSAVS